MSVATAWLSLRHRTDDDRALAFAHGFQRLGYVVRSALPSRPGPLDVLCIWNRFGDNARAASQFERAGRPVFVAENGYLGVDFAGDRWYAISRSYHNGGGTWTVGGAERWDALGVDLAPWRTGGIETVILAQRGIGSPPVAMPRDWPQSVAHMGRTRRHPGNSKPAIPLERDLARARACITWGSGAALQALVWGIPVFYAYEDWIGGPASRPLKQIERGPLRDDEARLACFRRLAWAMWRIDEINSGEALQHLGA
jgi:hypothetical protein